MNVTFEKTGNVSAIITIDIALADYQDDYKKGLNKAGRDYKIPGFRPGHVPASLLQKYFGKNVKADVIDKLVGNALYDKITEEKLSVLGQPMSANDEAIDLDKDDVTFKFEVGFAPEINATVDNETVIPYYNITVADEMVEKQLGMLQDQFGSQVDGDTTNAEAFVKGTATELNEDGSVKEGGIVAEGTSILISYVKDEEQKNLFLDKHVGDKVVFNPAKAYNDSAMELASLLSIEKGEAETVKSNFEFAIAEIKVKKQAELNQEFFDMAFGKDKVTDVEQAKAEVKSFIEANLKRDSNFRFTIDAEKVLEEKAGDIELPTEFLKKWLLKQDEKKYNAENIDAEYDKMVPGLKWQLIKESIVKAADVKIEDEDVTNAAKAVAAGQFAQYGMGNVPDDVLDRYAKQILENKDYRNNIVNQAVEEKMYAYIREKASVEEKSVSVDEFNALFEIKEA